MTDIMKLADGYASALGDARADLGANAGMDEQDPMWIAMKEARAALQSAIESLIAERDAYQQAADRYESYWNKATAKNRQMVARMEALARIVMADQVAHDLPEIKSPKPLYQLITEENVRWLDEQEKTLNGENTCSQNSTT